MKFIISTIFLLFSYIFTNAQENNTTPENKVETQEEPKTLENQFDWLYRTSTRYKAKDGKVYRVVSEEGYQNLKKQVLDSINTSKSIINQKEAEITQQQKTITNINNDLEETSTKLKTSQTKENSMSLFGFQMTKTNYNLLLWSLIGLFLILSIYFLIKYRNSNVYTKEAQFRQNEVEEELEQFRKKSLVREQKLRRQLQDEINKQK